MTAMRVASNEEGEGGKAMAMVTRVVGERTAMASKRAIAMKTREAGKEESDGKGGKSNGGIGMELFQNLLQCAVVCPSKGEEGQ